MRERTRLAVGLFIPLLLVAMLNFTRLPGGGEFLKGSVTLLAAALVAAAIYILLEPLDAISDVLEGIAKGKRDLEVLPEEGTSDIARIAEATNLLRVRHQYVAEQASMLAEGTIDVAAAQKQVMASGDLSDADDKADGKESPIERDMRLLGNRLRQLTIQARIISSDHLSSELLNETVPGELGDSFHQMVTNLRELKDRAREIADGDLSRRVEGDGELTTAFNDMVSRFERLSAEITQTGLHISSAVEQILAVLREQEFAASHQASSVEETQRTMETLLSSAKRIAESAQTVFKSAEKTQANNRTVGERIAELKTHTERIGEILEVIKSIADRSDLLALNASLEGMRAGEAGKGFTLVAGEMRRLAESIKESVSDIKELLSDIRASALASVMSTEDGSSLSEKTTESALKITLITQQQQSGTEQVTQSMDELSSLINQSVAGMRQVTTAASELVLMSETLSSVARGVGAQSSVSESSIGRPRTFSEVIRSEAPASRSRELAVAEPEPKPKAKKKKKAKKSSNENNKATVTIPVPEVTQLEERTSDISFGVASADPPTLELAGFDPRGEQTDQHKALIQALRRVRTSLSNSLPEDSAEVIDEVIASDSDGEETVVAFKSDEEE